MQPVRDNPLPSDRILVDKIQSYIETYHRRPPRERGFEIVDVTTYEEDFHTIVRVVGESHEEVAVFDNVSVGTSTDFASLQEQVTMNIPEQAQVSVKIPFHNDFDEITETLDDCLEKLEKRFCDADFTLSSHEILRDGGAYECRKCAMKQELPEAMDTHSHEIQQQILYAALSTFYNESCDAVVHPAP